MVHWHGARSDWQIRGPLFFNAIPRKRPFVPGNGFCLHGSRGWPGCWVPAESGDNNRQPGDLLYQSMDDPVQQYLCPTNGRRLHVFVGHDLVAHWPDAPLAGRNHVYPRADLAMGHQSQLLGDSFIPCLDFDNRCICPFKQVLPGSEKKTTSTDTATATKPAAGTVNDADRPEITISNSLDEQLDQIQKLSVAKEQGLLTEEEFQAKKRLLLGI